MTKLEKRVQGYINTWRKILRLEDWRIKLEVIPRGYANWNSNLGQSRVVTHLKCVELQILEPTDEVTDAELEATVVHELLHIHLDCYPWRQDATRDIQMEQVIDTLSILLIKLKHPKWKDPRENCE